MKILAAFLSLLFLVPSLSNAQTIDLVLGNPSDAKPDEVQTENFLVEHTTYVLSFNKKRLAANWVAWHVQKSDLGVIDRSNDFRSDKSLPAGWRISGATFGTPFDRGHMCPSGDRTKTRARNSETFLMSNMQAQHKYLNQKTWKYFEDYIRGQVNLGFEAYEYAGCYGGDKTLSKNGMTVPTNCWKIVVFITKGSDDINRIDMNTRVVAIDMPNDGSTRLNDWPQYRTTVASIEEATGFHFLSTLAQTVRDNLKATKDTASIPKTKRIVKKKKRLVR